MRQTAEQFLATAPKTLAPLYVIYGAEPLASLEAADHLRKLARELGYVEREVFTVLSAVTFDWSSLTASGNALSLFATQRLLELRMPTGKPGTTGSAAIEKFCERLPDDTITLVILPEIDWQTSNTKWFLALQQAAHMIEAKPVERSRLPDWLSERLARNKQTAQRDVLEFLADRVEGNLLAARQEIDKLALLYPAGEIPMAAMEASVSNVSRFNPFQLTEAIHQGDAARIARMLDGLKAEGEAPPLILWVLANELRTLMRAAGSTRFGRPPSPAKARELERTAKRHTKAALNALLLQSAQIDRMIKGLDQRDSWTGLLHLALGIAGKPLFKDSLKAA